MRVIFLDIDGVLNGHQKHPNGLCGIEKENVTALNKLLDALPDLKIVISSAWRYMIPEAMTLRGFEYLLLVCGANAKERVIGTTVRDEVASTRGAQIKEYLRTNKIKKYLIIDDMGFDFFEQGLKYLLTNGQTGLTILEAEEAIRYFQNESL